MNWPEWYLPVKHAHMALVAASGGLFALRGAAVLAGGAWALRKPWRLLSYAIDTLLLAAGLTLWSWLNLNPAHDAWLGTKFGLLVVYIVLGSLALKRGRTASARRASYAAAIAVFLFIASVAMARHPLGWFAGWGLL